MADATATTAATTTNLYEQQRRLFDMMKLLSLPEQEEIFRILRKHKESYTENSNGIFFDLSTLSMESFEQIKEYLNFCMKTRQDMDVRIREMEDIRIQNQKYTEEDKPAPSEST